MIRIVIGIMLWVPFVAIAAETSGDFALCDSLSAIKELYDASYRKDSRQLDALMKDGGPCLMPKAGVPLSIIGKFKPIFLQVRIYVGDEDVVLYTDDDGVRH